MWARCARTKRPNVLVDPRAPAQNHPQLAYDFLMRYILGFDGGGTKTECVLMNSSNQILARTFGGPSNPFRIGVENALRAVQESASLALSEAGLDSTAVVAIGAGLAGTTNADLHRSMRAGLQNAFPGASVLVITDQEAALAAVGDGPAIVLLAGTGSFAIGRNAQGETYRAGGYGPSSSDEGSAYDIGRQAIARAIAHRHQTATDSPLGAQILDELGCSEWSQVEQRAQSKPDEVFPKVFPVVALAADAGDSSARQFLLQAAQDLTSLVADVADHLSLREAQFIIAKTGGAMGRSTFLDSQLDAALKKIAPHARIGGLRVSPAEAAALAAKY
jgi:N-acetylglucosamine kinase-like BadF-type ATPase